MLPPRLPETLEIAVKSLFGAALAGEPAELAEFGVTPAGSHLAAELDARVVAAGLAGERSRAGHVNRRRSDPGECLRAGLHQAAG